MSDTEDYDDAALGHNPDTAADEDFQPGQHSIHHDSEPLNDPDFGTQRLHEEYNEDDEADIIPAIHSSNLVDLSAPIYSVPHEPEDDDDDGPDDVELLQNNIRHTLDLNPPTLFGAIRNQVVFDHLNHEGVNDQDLEEDDLEEDDIEDEVQAGAERDDGFDEE